MSGSSFAWELGAPIFYRQGGGIIDDVAADPVSLASRTDDWLDPIALLQDTALGFQLGQRTLFHSVHRLLPWERIEDIDGERSVQVESYGAAPNCVMDVLSARTSEAFSTGAALELTAGLDSGLLLAAGLRNGVKPKFSFTLGNENDPDVLGAVALARRFGFPHRSVPVTIDRRRIVQDSKKIIRASGYSLNAACYAWLPGTLALLDDDRDSQVTGACGEVVGGFYYTPFDSFIEPLHLQKHWVKSRLVQNGVAWRNVWERDVLGARETELLTGAIGAVCGQGGNWCEKVDAFYRNERVRRWAVPVLDASSLYYKVIAPYLSREYFAWSVSLPYNERVGRLAQHKLLQNASPGLAEFRASQGGATARSKAALLKKIFKRLANRRRPSALGTAQCAIVLAADSEIRRIVRSLSQHNCAGLNRTFIDHVLKHPGEHPELLGSIITAAVAWHDLQRS